MTLLGRGAFSAIAWCHFGRALPSAYFRYVYCHCVARLVLLPRVEYPFRLPLQVSLCVNYRVDFTWLYPLINLVIGRSAQSDPGETKVVN